MLRLARLGSVPAAVAAAYDALIAADVVIGLFTPDPSYANNCLKISDGTNELDIGFNDEPSEDGNRYISAAEIAASGVNLNADGISYDVAGIYCQKTGVYLSQRSFSIVTNRIKLVLNDSLSGKPAIIFPAAGANALHDNVNAGQFTDLFNGGGSFLAHVCNTATGGTSNRRIWSKGAGNALYYSTSTSARLLRDYDTTDKALGITTPTFNQWYTIVGKHIEGFAEGGSYAIDGGAWQSMGNVTTPVGSRVSDAAEKFAIGAGTSGATGHAFGGGISMLAFWRSLLS